MRSTPDAFLMPMHIVRYACAVALLLAPAAVAAQDTTLTAAEVRAASTPIRTVDPTDEDFSDLQFLKTTIGDARVVVLGEQTHYDGTSTAAKARLIKFLHREMGFDVLVFENDMWHVRYAMAELRRGKPLARMTWPQSYQYAYGETRPLQEYIARQARTAKPLEVVGMDSWYTVSEPEDAEVLGPAIYSFFDAASPSILTHELIDFIRQVRHPYTSGPRTPSTATTERDQAAFRALIALLDANRDALVRAHGRKEVDFMRLALENRVLFPRFYELLGTGRRTDADYVVPREEQMGKVLTFLATDYYARRKLIVWASHSHTMKHGIELGLAGHRNAVERLEAKLPAGAMIGIGFTAHEGTSGRGVQVIGEVGASFPGSLEWAANEVGPEYQLVDLRKLSGQYRSKLWPRPQKLSEWKNSFELVLFMRTQRPLTAAPR